MSASPESPPKLNQILSHIQWMSQQGFLWASEGNFSIRDGEGFWITPSGQSKADLRPSEFIWVPLNGKIPDGISSEWPFHRAIYQGTSAQVVYHAHPPYTVAASTTLPPFYEPVIEEVRLLESSFMVVEAPTGTPDLARKILQALQGDSRVVILRNHGVVTIGQTPNEAFHRMQRVEREFQILTLRKCWESSR